METSSSQQGSVLKRKRSHSTNNIEVSFDALISPNFEELARRFPDFCRAYRNVQQQQRTHGGSFSEHISQDFSIALTKALLHVYFHLSLRHLPEHHLCPPIPNRYFYVQWLQKHVLPCTRHCFHTARPLCQTGLDIGTGATCIYPLLFDAAASSSSSQDGNYQLFATDVDPEAVQLAKLNVQDNIPNLKSSIEVFLVPPTSSQAGENDSTTTSDVDIPMMGPLRQSLACLPTTLVQSPLRRLDFCMTNPPFFDSRLEKEEGSMERRAGDGRMRTSMTVSEGSYPGGEVAFVLDMFVDALVLFVDHHRNQHHQGTQQQSQQQLLLPPLWSSCMCGKKSSWLQLKAILTKLLGPSHVLASEFGPGYLTRWFLAWTFEQPQIRSPLAKATSWTFVVDPVSTTDSDFIKTTTQEEARNEVVRRIVEYCETLPGWQFTADVSAPGTAVIAGERQEINIQIRETQPSWAPVEIDNDDATLPAPIPSILRRMDPVRRMQLLLPPEGHFLLDVTVSSSSSGRRQRQPQEDDQIRVQVDAYQHSSYGAKLVEKFKIQLQGEVCRTNRRWRRKLKRQQQAEQQQQQCDMQAMDES